MRNTFIPLSAALTLILAISIAITGRSEARSVSTVLELFSSQGCSSCPPADELLKSYVARDDVLALSLPVDYWDNLGWKDTLGSPKNSQRQYDYAHQRGDRSVYTPQIVVNGVAHVPGYDRRRIDQEIEAANLSLRRELITMSINSVGETIQVSVSPAKEGAQYRSGTLWLVLYSKLETVSIGAGENAGRTLSYVNVVREMMPVGMWHGDADRITLPRADIMNRGHEGCAVLLQAGMAGPILGAAVMDSW